MGVSNFKIFEINGKQVKLFYVNRLAEELGRTPQTIRKWEVGGLLPKAFFKDSSGRRMYSEDQINVIVEIAEKCNLRAGYSVANTNFAPRVFKALEEVNKQYLQSK